MAHWLFDKDDGDGFLVRPWDPDGEYDETWPCRTPEPEECERAHRVTMKARHLLRLQAGAPDPLGMSWRMARAQWPLIVLNVVMGLALYYLVCALLAATRCAGV